MDASTLPKGHIIGWAPPPATTKPTSVSGASLSKAAKKNEKRKEKRKEKREEGVKVKDSWEDEDEGEEGEATAKGENGMHTPDKPNWAAAPETRESVAVRLKTKNTEPMEDTAADKLADKLDKLEVR